MRSHPLASHMVFPSDSDGNRRNTLHHPWTLLQCSRNLCFKIVSSQISSIYHHKKKKCRMGHQSSLPTPNTLTLSWKYQRRILYMRSHHLVSKGSRLLSAQSHPPFLSCSQVRPFSAGCVMLKLEYPISL